MARLNTAAAIPRIYTHEGAPAARINAEQQLRRVVMASMLWENQFYIDGKTNAEIIAETVPRVDPETVAAIAIEAREKQKLRHVPLLLVRELARRKDCEPGLVARTIERVIQRPDELAELLAIYWKDGRTPIAAQVKKGLAKAFRKFSAYQLAKYDREGPIRLRDVLFMTHPKPKASEQAATWKALVEKSLESPDTWEVAISAAKSEEEKRTEWTRLLAENKLGALALLRNLRNLTQAGVDQPAIRRALAEMKTDRVLPFRFIAAARIMPNFEDALEPVMLRCAESAAKLAGHTLLLVDVSGSMTAVISAKSDLTRIDAACGVAMLLREACERATIVTFSDLAVIVPPRRGFALRDVIVRSQPHNCTYLGNAVKAAMGEIKDLDRVIVVTDEQSHDSVPNPIGRGYIVNVAAHRNGVGYGAWRHIDGWSEACIDYIAASEAG